PEVGHKVWVADFGLSLDQTAERNTIDGEVIGPRFFMAPELDEGGAVNVTPAADIYSLGQLIFYMLTGGKRIPRENVFDSRYADFFAKGPRHELLRLLLSKKVRVISSPAGIVTKLTTEDSSGTGGIVGAMGIDVHGSICARHLGMPRQM